MATWKKVIVSGSAAEFASVSIGTNQSITTAQATTQLTGSFTGSFTGNGAGLTGVTATATFPAVQITPITAGTQLFANDGTNKFIVAGQITGSTYAGISGDVTIGTDGVSAIGAGKVTNTMLAGSISNANLANSTITIGTTSTALGASNTSLVGLVSVTSTGFTGALTGNASTAAALQTSRTINGTSFNGTADITVTAAAATLTGTTLASNVLASSLTSVGTLAGVTITGTAALATVTVSNNLTVSGDLFVNGTTTSVNTSNLFVADKFVTLASGSATTGDGGIIIDRGSDAAGNTSYGFDSATTRWGYQTGLVDGDNAINPASSNGVSGSFACYIFTEAAHGATKPTTGEFVVAGSMYVNTDGSIFIYG